MFHKAEWVEVLLNHPVEFFCCVLSVGEDVWFCGFSQDSHGELRLLVQIRDDIEVS